MEQLKYEESGIDKKILRGIKEMCFEVMTPIQAQAIPVFLEGKDIIGQAQTGTGKTAAFGIPIIQNIDVNAYAKANNLNGKTDAETFMRLLKELENA